MPRRAQQKLAVADEGSRSAEMDWLRKNQGTLSNYRGEWVALDGSQLVAHAAGLETLLKLAEMAGRPHPLVTHVRVEPIINLEV